MSESKDKKVPTWAIIVGVILVIGGIGAAMGAGKKDEPKDEGGKDDFQYKVEEKCQDADYIAKYVNINDYGVVSLADSWEQYTGSTGMYNADGKELVNYRWHGKDKKAGQTITFDCWAAGDKDNITIYGYSIGDKIYLDWQSFTWYNKDGSKQE